MGEPLLEPAVQRHRPRRRARRARPGTPAHGGVGRRLAHARVVGEADPDVVVSTHPAVTNVLGFLRRRGRLTVPVVATITAGSPIITILGAIAFLNEPPTLAQAAAPITAAKATPRKPANAKCTIAPTTTWPAETGIAFITIARADGLIMDIRLAVVELVALPLISMPIRLTAVAGTCMPISVAPSLCIIGLM